MVQQILFARNTEKVTTMNRMFAFNENITTIYVSDKFVTTALTNDEDIFIQLLETERRNRIRIWEGRQGICELYNWIFHKIHNHRHQTAGYKQLSHKQLL